MDAYRKIGEYFKAVGQQGLQATIAAADVVKITGESCTVKMGDLQLTDVRLKATVNGEENKILLLPKVGSKVLVGSLTGDMRDLCVLKIDEIEKVVYQQRETKILIDATQNSIKCDAAGTLIELKEKVRVENPAFNLLNLVLEFIGICKSEIHMTNAGPTVSLNPASMAKFVALENKFKALLK